MFSLSMDNQLLWGIGWGSLLTPLPTPTYPSGSIVLCLGTFQAALYWNRLLVQWLSMTASYSLSPHPPSEGHFTRDAVDWAWHLFACQAVSCRARAVRPRPQMWQRKVAHSPSSSFSSSSPRILLMAQNVARCLNAHESSSMFWLLIHCNMSNPTAKPTAGRSTCAGCQRLSRHMLYFCTTRWPVSHWSAFLTDGHTKANNTF